MAEDISTTATGEINTETKEVPCAWEGAFEKNIVVSRYYIGFTSGHHCRQRPGALPADIRERGGGGHLILPGGYFPWIEPRVDDECANLSWRIYVLSFVGSLLGIGATEKPADLPRGSRRCLGREPAGLSTPPTPEARPNLNAL
ncbi:hypothetical protein Bbelb_295490 [Branchiostoma belcheri]|nr:hypothetical protein Bbelb_295490 [Branchiostoma belcheri]